MILQDILRGLEARQPQTVGNMTVVPLVAQGTEYQNVGSLADIYLNRDVAYDQLEMAADAEYPSILPAGYTLITDERAQDRAVSAKTIVPAKKHPVQVNAFCVQSSQAGHMNPHNKEMQQVRMLPATVRMAAYHQRTQRNYSALWQSLGAYNRNSGVGGDFLRSYFNNFKQQLDEFIAEFELIPNQRGAIILINDEVLGVELSPNPKAWAAQWEPLIRDCYGSEAIAQQEKYVNDQPVSLPVSMQTVQAMNQASTLDELAEAVNTIDEEEWQYAESLVSSILGQDFTVESRSSGTSHLSVVGLNADDYIGEAVMTTDGHAIDITLLRKDVHQRKFRFRR